jgi:hypothetical protein
VDDFFNRPYVPSAAAAEPEAADFRAAVTPARRPVGVLLGGKKPA